MKVLATSDLHGYLPDPDKVPPCDLLLIGGDVCPIYGVSHFAHDQAHWLDTKFRNWLSEMRCGAKEIVGIAGNHDFVFEQMDVEAMHLPWIYLQDSTTVVNGLKVWGIPWVPNLPLWAFHQKTEGLKDKYDLIPSDVDIILSHGPPFGLGDFSVMGHYHVGCKSANDVLRRVRPQAFVCGHIHEGYGHYRQHVQHSDPIDVYNVSYVNEDYNVHQVDTLVEIPVDVITDGEQDPTDKQCEVHDPHSGARHASESSAGSEPDLLAVA